MVTAFKPPLPLNTGMPAPTNGQIDTSPIFWRMPRKLYRLLKSTPPVTATFGACAAAGAAKTPRRPAHSATDIVALQIARLIQPSTRNGSQAPGRTGL